MSVTASDIRDAIAKRYPSDAYAIAWEVSNSTGAGAGRWADAVALGLWPSRGLHFSGFEIKVSRSDWLRELARPAKAEAIAKYCHTWWIAASDASVVKTEELPQPWGLMILKSNGKLSVSKAAESRTPEPPPMAFIAALMRAMQKPNIEAQNSAMHKQYELWRENACRDADRRATNAENELQELRRQIFEFENASGVSLNTRWEVYSQEKIGRTVMEVLRGEHKRDRQELLRCRDIASKVIEWIDNHEALNGNDILDSARRNSCD